MKIRSDTTMWYSATRGFGESHYIACPVCWSSGIAVTLWEDGSEDIGQCDSCKKKAAIAKKRSHKAA